MLTKTTFLAVAFSATASAQMRSPVLIARQTLDSADPISTTSTSPECESRIESWTANFPTPAPALENALEDADNSESGFGSDGISGLCEFAGDLPVSITAAFSSYNLEMYSYLSAQSSNLLALATTCSDDMGAPPSVITSQLDELLGVYSSFSAGACGAAVTTTDSASPSATKTASKSGLTSVVSSTGSSAATASATSSSGSSESAAAASGTNASASSSTTVSQNAGPRETGMFAAAAVAMGVLGAAVVL